MDRAREWPAANRLHAFDVTGRTLLDPLVARVWVPTLQGRSARSMVWRLVTDLVAAVEPHLGDLPVPPGVSGLDRLSWALGGTPGHVDRLVAGTDGPPVQAHDLGALLYLAGVDRAGLETAIGQTPLSALVAGAGLDSTFEAAAAQAEAGTTVPSTGWVRAVADAAGMSVARVEGAWVAGAVSWAAGSTPACGLGRSRQALAGTGDATLWQRRILSPGLSVPAEWVVLDGEGTLADLAAVMDEVGDGSPEAPSPHWQWRVPVTGVVMTPDTVARGMLLLGCLDLAASPDPVRGAGPWAVGDATRTRAADAVAVGGSALLVDGRTTSAAATFTLQARLGAETATADQFLRAQSGAVAARAWPSSGVAVDVVFRAPRP